MNSFRYPGLPSRVEREVKQLYLQKIAQGDLSRLKKFKIKVEDPPRRKHMVWLGGSVLADIMKDKPQFWITQEDWKEYGVRAIDKLGPNKS